MRCIPLVVSLLLAGCPRSQDASPAPMADAASALPSAAPAPSIAPTVEAGGADAGTCADSMLQPGLCAPFPQSLSYEAMKAWFDARDVDEEAWHFSSCDELRFGAEPEAVLLCADDGPFWLDRSRA